MIASLVIIVVLFIISALVAGSETAFFSLSSSNVRTIRKSDSKVDQTIIKLLEDQNSVLATTLIVNNLVNICIIILSNNVIDRVVTFSSGAWEFGIKLVVVTFSLLLVGEIMPKILATYNPMRLARFMAIPLSWLKVLVKPLSFLLIRSGSVVSDKMTHKRAQISIDELSDAMTITRNHSEEEHKMLSGIVSFVNTEAADIMKLRIDVIALEIGVGFEQVKRTIMESGYSRIPVYEENLDKIKGILYVKDMIAHVTKNDDFRWQEHLRSPYFVPEHKKINDLLEEFQTSKVHIAIIVDEYGSTQGLVSLEDILEEIVGDIYDELDNEKEKIYKRIGRDKYLFEGKTHLSDFMTIIGLEPDYFEDVSGDVETIAGMMVELNNDFLKVGNSVSYKGVTLTVLSLEGRRIERVKVSLEIDRGDDE